MYTNEWTTLGAGARRAARAAKKEARRKQKEAEEAAKKAKKAEGQSMIDRRPAGPINAFAAFRRRDTRCFDGDTREKIQKKKQNRKHERCE